MTSRQELLSAKEQIQELLRSVKLTDEQRDHYTRELAELDRRLLNVTFSSDARANATSDSD